MSNSQFADEELRKKTAKLYQEAREREAQRKALSFNIAYLDGMSAKIQLDALRLLPKEDALAHHIAPIYLHDNQLTIVTSEQPNQEALHIIDNFKKHYSISLYFISNSAFERILTYYNQIPKTQDAITGAVSISQESLNHYLKEFSDFSKLKSGINSVSQERLSESFEIVLSGAIANDASDIHVEPTERGAELRLRIDGILQNLSLLTPRFYQLLLNRIKLLSGMKLNIHDSPQDGRFSVKTTSLGEIEIRASVLPGPVGENIVLRVLNPKIIRVALEQLGLEPFQEKLVVTELEKPNGMILVTGPTGSGKTTSLYAFLKKSQEEPGLKIITIEDPIEYHLEGIEQTQVSPEKKYTFANGLRSVLRQDPDIIMIGEMRDLETVETALHAALTGHIVFSTLHTNDAAGTIPRLIDMGAKTPIIAPAINIAIAQRLVRKVCTHCSQKEKATKDELKTLQKGLNSMPEIHLKKPFLSDTLTLSKAKGCAVCNGTGYKGRVGVFELFQITNEMEQLILKSPTELEIKMLARKQGMVNMYEAGLLKVIAGITTLEELGRVVGSL